MTCFAPCETLASLGEETKPDGACDITRASVNDYTYRAEWWPVRGEYVAPVYYELPWLNCWALSLQEATAAVEHAVDEYLAERTADGDEVPA